MAESTPSRLRKTHGQPRGAGAAILQAVALADLELRPSLEQEQAQEEGQEFISQHPAAERLPEVLRFAAAARGSIEYGRIGLPADLYYVSVGDSSSQLVGERESAVGEQGQFTILPYGGIRILQGDLDIKATLAGPLRIFERTQSQSFGRTWVQPVPGTHVSVFLTPRPKAFLRGDQGAFGLAGEKDLSASAQVGLADAVGISTSLNASWRYRAVAWDNGANEPNAYTSYQHGIEAGVKFFF